MRTTVDIQAIAIPDSQPTIDLANSTPMTLEEAEAGWQRVNMAAEFTQYQLLELYRRKAWLAYVNEDGNPIYGGWQECAMDKLNKGRTAVHYQLKSAELQARLIDQGLDQFTVVNLTESSTYIRYITQAPEAQQGEVAQKLIEWSQLDEVTEKDAEAALLSVDRSKRSSKAKKLVSEFFTSSGEETPFNINQVFEWAQKNKGLTSRQQEVLRDDVKGLLQERPNTSTPKKSGGSGLSTPNQSQPDKSLEIVRTVAHLKPEVVIAAFKKNKVPKEEATALAEAFYQLCEAIDDAFQ